MAGSTSRQTTETQPDLKRVMGPGLRRHLLQRPGAEPRRRVVAQGWPDSDPSTGVITAMAIVIGVGSFAMSQAVSVVSVLTSDQIADASEGRALLEVVRVGAPDLSIDRVFPFLAVFAVANTALITMLMASRLPYGLANQDVLPRVLGEVSRTSHAPYVGIAFSTVHGSPSSSASRAAARTRSSSTSPA